MKYGHLATKLRAVAGAMTGNRLRILLYHSVSYSPDDPFAVTPEAFRGHLAWLGDHGYTVITLEEGLRRLRLGTSLRRQVVLTFDDGLRDFADNAVPVLSDAGVPSTLCVPMGCVGGQSDWTSPGTARPILDWRELQALQRAGVMLASHGMRHRRLPELPPEQAAWEVEESGRLLRKVFGQQFLALAYPYGAAGPRELEMAQRAGYDCALLAGGLWGNGAETNMLALTREMITARTTLPEFASLCSGRADWTRLVRSLMGR